MSQYVLTRAGVTFHTNDEDKDADTHVAVQVRRVAETGDDGSATAGWEHGGARKGPSGALSAAARSCRRPRVACSPGP